jgi:hypothetical protein
VPGMARLRGEKQQFPFVGQTGSRAAGISVIPLGFIGGHLHPQFRQKRTPTEARAVVAAINVTKKTRRRGTNNHSSGRRNMVPALAMARPLFVLEAILEVAAARCGSTGW